MPSRWTAGSIGRLSWDEYQLLLNFGQGQGTILKRTIDHARDHAPARHGGFGGKFKTTGTRFVPDEATFIKKKAIARGVHLIRIDRIEADELSDFVESGEQVDGRGALDGWVNQEGFHQIRVSVRGLRAEPRSIIEG
jgi:hypothetical protein